MSIQVCPRCSKQIAGWITNENGFRSCLMCGKIISDPGYKHSNFSGLLRKARESDEKKEAMLRLQATLMTKS